MASFLTNVKMKLAGDLFLVCWGLMVAGCVRVATEHITHKSHIFVKFLKIFIWISLHITLIPSYSTMTLRNTPLRGGVDIV